MWKKSLINYNLFHVGRKKIIELWPTNKNVVVAHIDQPKWTFFGRLHFGHYGVLPLKFLHALDIDPGYLKHNPTGTGVPRKILVAKKIKICPKIQRVNAYNFGAIVGVSARNFSRRRAARHVVWVQFLEGPIPKMFSFPNIKTLVITFHCSQ